MIPKAPRITVTEMQGLSRGWFNGATLERPDGGYVLVIRDQSDFLHGGVLTEQFNVASSFEPLRLDGNIDPRLTRWNGRPYMTSRYYGDWEYWRLEFWPLTENGNIDHHDEKWKHTRFMTVEDWPEYTRRREANWAPFISNDGELHYVHSFAPHRVLWYDRGNKCVRRVTEETTRSIIWSDRFCEYRLNTNPVRLPDGTMLSTIHAKDYSTNCYYTGFYRFQGDKPYRVLSMSGRPVIEPRHCVGPLELRNYAQYATFPLSLHVKGNDVMMVGGSRDACNVVVRAHLDEVLKSLVEI